MAVFSVQAEKGPHSWKKGKGIWGGAGKSATPGEKKETMKKGMPKLKKLQPSRMPRREDIILKAGRAGKTIRKGPSQ